MRYGPHDNIQSITHDPQLIYSTFEQEFSAEELQDAIDDSVDMVNSPPHYMILDDRGNKITETINVLRHVCRTLTGVFAGFYYSMLGYLMRAPLKGNMLEDLKKGRYYLDRCIEDLEAKQ